MQKPEMKTLLRCEIEQIHEPLPHRKKKELANFLGLWPESLSRYLNGRNGTFKMPQTVYDKILEFINLNKTTNGPILSAEVQKEKPANRTF